MGQIVLQVTKTVGHGSETEYDIIHESPHSETIHIEQTRVLNLN